MSVPSANWDSDVEREILAEACYHNFWHFTRLAFGVDLAIDSGNESPWLDEKVHRPLCDWLQDLVLRWLESRRRHEQARWYLMAMAARGIGKSVIVTKSLTMWIHLRDPNMSSVIDAVTSDQACEFADVIRKIYAGQDSFALFPWLYGLWADPDTWTRARFNTRARTINRSEASVETSSVETGRTGKHPSHGSTDDPITLQKLGESGNWIAKAKKHVRSFYPVLTGNSLYVICATPYEDGDVVTSEIRDRGIKEVYGYPLPREYREYIRPDGQWHVFHMPAVTEGGEPLIPSIWPRDALERWATEQPADYASQAMLRPGIGENVPLTLKQIEQCFVAKKDVPWNLSYTIHCDTAFKRKDRMGRGDESVIQVWGHHPSNGDVYFIEGYGSSSWRSEHFTDKLIELVQRYRKSGKRIRWITDEPIIGGKDGVWRKHLQSCFQNADDGHGRGMFMPPFLEIPRAGKRKEDRIREILGYWVDGHVYLVQNAPGLAKLMWQMSRIGVSDKDDWADAAADVFHPEVYRPYRVDSPRRAPEPRHPGDETLKDGSIGEARRYYDAYTRGSELVREPVK